MSLLGKWATLCYLENKILPLVGMLLIWSSCLRCLILRATGELSLIDLDDGHERELTEAVELFWVTCCQSEDKTNLIEEVSWLDYGRNGMQVIIHQLVYICLYLNV